MRERDRIILWALAAGAVLRVIYFFWSQELPFFDHPITDALYHHRLAEAMAGGVWWDGRPYFRAPLYPYLLGTLYSAFGPHIALGKLMGHAFGLATGGLTIGLAHHVYGRRGALVAALLWLGSGLLIFFEGELLVDATFTFLTVLSIYLLLTSDDRTTRLPASGWAFGLAVVTRPTILIAAPLFAWWAWRTVPPAGRRRLAAAALLAILPLAVVSGINSSVVGRAVGPATQGGVNFYIGNNLAADGCTAVLPEPWGYAWNYRTLARHAERMTVRDLDDFEVSDYYYGQGLDFIVDHPGRAASLALKKVILSVHRVHISNNLNLPYLLDRIPLLKWLAVRVAWLVPLALFAWILPCHRPRVRTWLWLFVATYTLVFVLFFVNERFRLPLAPLWIVLASGVGCAHAGLDRRAWIRGLLLGLGGVLVCWPNWYRLQPENDALAYFNLGNVAMRQGDNDAALVMYDSAAAVDTDLRQLRLNRGLAHLRLGNRAHAAGDFRMEAQRFPFDARPYNNLAAVHLLNGDTAAALHAIDSGLQRDSGLILLYRQRLAVAGVREDLQTIQRTLATARRFAGNEVDWSYWDAEVMRLTGQTGAARHAYRSSLATGATWPGIDAEVPGPRAPGATDIDYRIGLTFVAEAHLDSAEEYFSRAALADSGFAESWANWGTAAMNHGNWRVARSRYRVSLRADPAAPVVWTNLALAFLGSGFVDSARVALDAALHIDSGFVPALTIREELDRANP